MSAPTPDNPSGLTRQQKVAAMGASLLGIFLAALDQTVVATAGPTMQRDLHIAPSLYVWMTTSYVVASTVMVPMWGKLSDLFGRKRTLLLGMTLFLFGSALCATAGSLETLILYRVVQGVGSAALFTNAFAVTADLFAPAERGKYQGLFGGVFGLASVIGPWVGGLLTDHVGWHWVFLINLPIGAIALAVAVASMPPLRRPRTAPLSIDVAGAVLLIVAMVPLLLALSLGHGAHPLVMMGPDGTPDAPVGWPWGSWQILGLFATAVVGVLGFIVAERSAKDPILDLALFRKREFSLGCAAAFTAGLPFLAAIIFLPVFMTKVAGASASEAGQVLMPLTFGIVIANVSSGQIVSRIGRYKPVLLIALTVQVVGFVIMGLTVTSASTQLGVSLKMIILGLGLGPAIPLYTLAIQTSVPMHQIGIATSTAVFARSVGATIGAAVLGTVFATALASVPFGPQGPTSEAFTHAIRVLFQISAGIAALALLVTLVMPAVPLRQHQVPPQVGE
jgi:EmrB/QacA subfamily drug resistance transporter